jgi:hypothetical protein
VVKVRKAGSGGKLNLSRKVPWHAYPHPVFLTFAALIFSVTHFEVVPEPTTIMLLGLGAMVLRRRK